MKKRFSRAVQSRHGRRRASARPPSILSGGGGAEQNGRTVDHNFAEGTWSKGRSPPKSTADRRSSLIVSKGRRFAFLPPCLLSLSYFKRPQRKRNNEQQRHNDKTPNDTGNKRGTTGETATLTVEDRRRRRTPSIAGRSGLVFAFAGRSSLGACSLLVVVFPLVTVRWIRPRRTCTNG